MAAAPKKGGVDLALVLGGPSKGSSGSAPEPDADEHGGPDDGDADEVSPELESAAVEAFPELEGDTARIAALHRFVRLCSESY